MCHDTKGVSRSARPYKPKELRWGRGSHQRIRDSLSSCAPPPYYVRALRPHFFLYGYQRPSHQVILQYSPIQAT